MDIRYSCNQKDFKRYTTEEMRGNWGGKFAGQKCPQSDACEYWRTCEMCNGVMGPVSYTHLMCIRDSYRREGNTWTKKQYSVLKSCKHWQSGA